MKASFIKTKIFSLRKYDILKVLIDILVPELKHISDYNKNLMYRKGDKVFYYDKDKDESYILQANEDIPANSELDFVKWSITTGSNGSRLTNEDILEKISKDENNRLTYDGKSLGNVYIGNDEPVSMVNGDIWLTTQNYTEPTTNPEVIIKNMQVGDSQPIGKDILWGQIID